MGKYAASSKGGIAYLDPSSAGGSGTWPACMGKYAASSKGGIGSSATKKHHLEDNRIPN